MNFITEKSTNIMEKALLPQHLAMRYNHVSKSVETDTMGALCTTNKSPLENVTCKSDAVSTTSNDVLNITSCIKRDYDKSEDQHDGAVRKEVDLLASAKENKMHNSENEIISNEGKYYISKNNVDRLDRDATSGQLKCDFPSTETGENKINIPQIEKLSDIYKTESSDVRSLSDSNSAKYGSLEHPLHRMLLEDYANLKLKYLKLLERTGSPESNRLDRESQRNTDAHSSQVENLEKAVIKLTTDLNASLATQEALKNECIAVNKERENMVMKYVISEKQLIDSQRYVRRKKENDCII